MAFDLVSAIALIIGVIAIYQGGLNFYKYYKFASLSVSKISELKNGQLAKICGKATGKTLKAPLTGMNCIFYKVTIEESVWWKIRALIKSFWEFLPSGKWHIQSSNRIVVVDSSDVELIVSPKEWSSEFSADLPKSILAFEKEKNLSPSLSHDTSIARTVLRVFLVLICLYLFFEATKSFIQSQNLISLGLTAAFGWYIYKKGVKSFFIKRSLIDRPFRTFKEFAIGSNTSICVVGDLYHDIGNNIYLLKKSSLLGNIVCYPQGSVSSLDSLKLRTTVIFLFGLALSLYALSNILV